MKRAMSQEEFNEQMELALCITSPVKAVERVMQLTHDHPCYAEIWREHHKPAEEKHGYRCPICGGELCWESDFSAEEVLDREDDGGIVSYYHCMNCGREYEISDPVKEERETTYEKYWND